MKGPGRAGHAPGGRAAAGPGRSGHAPPTPPAPADWPAGAPDPGQPARGAGAGPRRWLAELAWLPGTGVRPGVLIEAAGDRFTAVTPGAARDAVPAGTPVLRGLTLPGLANAHSHAFHRALRGAVEADEGTFWTWRSKMYQLAAALDPGSYYTLARAVYAEMALAGITCVGEFHYLHHGPGGTPYADPNEMGRALLRAAADAGLRITLLDTCYLAAGLRRDGSPKPLRGVQLRFGDGDGAGWAGRVAGLGADARGMLGPGARAGAAIHSVRAVPPAQMHDVMAWSHTYGAPVHAHLSEQPAENEDCLAAYGRTPAQVLNEAGVLGPRSTVVHATHLLREDIDLLGATQTSCCLCPTTEADLADGIGPARALAAAGLPDQPGHRQQRRDRPAGRGPLAGAHAAAGQQAAGPLHRGGAGPGRHRGRARLPRLAGRRGDRARSAGQPGHRRPGQYPAGRDRAGRPGPAGAGPGAPGAVLDSVLFAATAADVRHVVTSGRDVVQDGRHLLVEDVPAELDAAVRAVLAVEE